MLPYPILHELGACASVQLCKILKDTYAFAENAWILSINQNVKHSICLLMNFFVRAKVTRIKPLCFSSLKQLADTGLLTLYACPSCLPLIGIITYYKCCFYVLNPPCELRFSFWQILCRLSISMCQNSSSSFHIFYLHGYREGHFTRWVGPVLKLRVFSLA